MWNNYLNLHRDDVATWSDIENSLKKDDYDRIGDYYLAFYRAAGYKGEIQRTLPDPFPNGIPPHMLQKSPRKQMKYTAAKNPEPNPALPLLPPPNNEDC
jgi:hypothetical protein